MASFYYPCSASQAESFTPEALAFLEELQSLFGARREELLRFRQERQRRLDAGEGPDFLPATRGIREKDWRIAELPSDLQDRRVEITGPVDRKMIINALNSGANMFMADFEDSSSPTWENMLDGQRNLRDAVRRSISFEDPRSGKHYALADKTAVLLVRPRGWHLLESHFLVNNEPMSASLFDFGLYFFHNAAELLAAGSGPYFYLPKLESHLEARLWNDVFEWAQAYLGIPNGTIKATVLIETILAAFEMDEILWELRDHAAGLNCGRWDYIFSFIKKFARHADYVLPNREQIGMTSHFLHSYSRLLIRTCHRRGAHAMGGMAAQIPIKGDTAANEAAMNKVRADKKREVGDGHDGTWVAHPGLVAMAREIFDAGMPDANQIDRELPPMLITAKDLLRVPQGDITLEGLRHNINVGLMYLEAWLSGSGCVPLYNLMEDAATAEICRSQLWQWTRHAAALRDGTTITQELVLSILKEEMSSIRRNRHSNDDSDALDEAANLFREMITLDGFCDFLTLQAYQSLITNDTASRTPVQTASSRRAFMADANTRRKDQMSLRWEEQRWNGIVRDFTEEDVERLRGSLHIQHTIADHTSRKLWDLLHAQNYIHALGALTGNQAMQMVRAGLKAIYLSGWQVAADANNSGNMYPDQSLYPVSSVPDVVRSINATLQRADQIQHMEGNGDVDWFAPIIADAEAGFGGSLNAFELMKAMIQAGAAGVHFEDQLASEKKCGHLGGKVLVPTQTFIRTLNAARFAADVMGVPTVLIARTDANSAQLLTSDVDERDIRFIEGDRTPEGFFRIKGGLECAIDRGLAYAPYADLLWCETSMPDIGEAREFAQAIHEKFPGKMLAYNCSPSFNWAANLDDTSIARFQEELGALGYRFQFITLAGFHNLNYHMFDLARRYKEIGMTAYSSLQQAEFASEKQGYTAIRHQREVGTGYFDAVSNAISGGQSSTTAMGGSTESDQFKTGTNN